MGIYLADQTVVFLQACLLGAALALLYDGFRITRMALPTPRAVVFVEDVVFFAACAICTFLLLMGAVEGRVRIFFLAGEVLGAVLYNLTVGQLVMGISRTIIRVVSAILRFFFKWLLRPVWRLIYNIVSILLRPFVFLGKFLKKILQKVKFSLKVRQRVLYNHCKGLFPIKLRPLRRRVAKESIDVPQAKEP